MSHHTPSTPDFLANQMTFGIEIECSLSRAAMELVSQGVGNYSGTGTQLVGAPEGWGVKYDGSLRTRRSGHTCVEIVSPILCGTDGLKQVEKVVQLLNEMDMKVNASMGIHIHVGTRNHRLPLDRNFKALQRLVALNARNEHALYASSGSKRREQCYYAASTRRQFAEVSRNATSVRCFSELQKYRTLNMRNLTGSKKTVEFRVFQSTTRIKKIAAYIQMVLGLVEKAYATKRQAKWSVNRNKWQGGYGAMKQLLLDLNWNNKKDGHEVGHRYGLLIDEMDPSELGHRRGLPNLVQMRKELDRLAKKYDRDERSSNYNVIDRTITATG